MLSLHRFGSRHPPPDSANPNRRGRYGPSRSCLFPRWRFSRAHRSCLHRTSRCSLQPLWRYGKSRSPHRIAPLSLSRHSLCWSISLVRAAQSFGQRTLWNCSIRDRHRGGAPFSLGMYRGQTRYRHWPRAECLRIGYRTRPSSPSWRLSKQNLRLP